MKAENMNTSIKVELAIECMYHFARHEISIILISSIIQYHSSPEYPTLSIEICLCAL